MSKPAPMLNAFSSGSKADLTQQNPIELNPAALNRKGSKSNLMIGNTATNSMMGMGSQPVSTQGFKTMYNYSGISGPIGDGYGL